MIEVNGGGYIFVKKSFAKRLNDRPFVPSIMGHTDRIFDRIFARIVVRNELAESRGIKLSVVEHLEIVRY